MQMTFPRTLLRRVRSQDAASDQQLGKYRLVATLGQGGMGTVYLALVRGPGEFRKLLVVKELRRELTQREGFVAMFMDEARLAARLDHPNVVQTLEVGEEAGRHFLAMEYLDGQPLSTLIQRLKETSALPLAVHIQILCEVLAGLHYAHELHDYDGRSLHVVHRDVSPQNVFVTYHGHVKVVDFGVAKVATAGNLTSPGVFKGKFAYAAPEQTMGHPVDARSDVFAVGVMLWEAIAGRRFAEQTPTVASFKARNQGLEPRIADVSSEVDGLLAEISDKALAVDPALSLRVRRGLQAGAAEVFGDLGRARRGRADRPDRARGVSSRAAHDPRDHRALHGAQRRQSLVGRCAAVLAPRSRQRWTDHRGRSVESRGGQPRS